MNDFIFEQKPGKKDILETQLYTLIGKEDFIDNEGFPRTDNENNTNIVAKVIVKNGSPPRYSIKIGLNNKLANPTSIYGKEKESSFLDSVCRANNKFIDVNLKTFEMYLQFLKTKNVSWLHNAEREMS
jgi:hypothetical protein